MSSSETKIENYDRDQRALSKSNKRDIQDIKADEELLAEINSKVVGVCTHKDCLKKAQLSGINAKFTLHGSKFDDHHSGQSQHDSNRKLLCLYCGCNTVMAWTPDAVTEHFNGNHAEFIAKYKSDRKARIADSNSSAELLKLRSQYSILEEQAEAAIDALNASELKWKNSNQDLETRNRELEDTCISLQNSFISALDHLGALNS